MHLRHAEMSNMLKWIAGFVIIEQVALGWSPSADRFTWVMENFPVWIGIVVVAFTYRRFPLSNLCLILLAVHSLILAVGGHYTYAKVPLGDWARDVFHLSRNHYDRLGHLAQGFVPAILFREILVRWLGLRGFPVVMLVVACCLAFSAFYELIEWWAALATGEAATAFLGTQGDLWDTQADMFCALIGSVASLAALSRLHDLSMQKIVAAQLFKG
jgi:putative membrane protein